MGNEERRKYPRIQIFDPISYLSLDSDGKTVLQNVAGKHVLLKVAHGFSFPIRDQLGQLFSAGIVQQGFTFLTVYHPLYRPPVHIDSEVQALRR